MSESRMTTVIKDFYADQIISVRMMKTNTCYWEELRGVDQFRWMLKKEPCFFHDGIKMHIFKPFRSKVRVSFTELKQKDF